MKRFRVAAVSAPILVAAALIAGCGDNEEKNDYVDQINEIQTQFVDDVNNVVSGQTPSTPDDAANLATDLADLTDQTADDIAAVDPPDEVADLQQELVSTLHDVADQIDSAGDAFSSGNPQQAAQAATELQTATQKAQTDLNRIIDEINSTLQD